MTRRYTGDESSGSTPLPLGAVSILIGIGVIVITTPVVAWMWGMPHYRIYKQEMNGKAALAEAVQDRQIAVEEARAKLESAKLLRQVEVERALGLAEATKIAVVEFGTPDDYLRYLWIENVASSTNDLIYIATEAGLPILEANRFNNLMEK